MHQALLARAQARAETRGPADHQSERWTSDRAPVVVRVGHESIGVRAVGQSIGALAVGRKVVFGTREA